MCSALIGKSRFSFPEGVHENYKKIVLKWEARAKEIVNGMFGYVNGTILHNFHGAKKNRKYVSRNDILLKHDYDPEMDSYKNSQGVLELEIDKKPALRDAIRNYFRTRNEDSPEMY